MWVRLVGYKHNAKKAQHGRRRLPRTRRVGRAPTPRTHGRIHAQAPTVKSEGEYNNECGDADGDGVGDDGYDDNDEDEDYHDGLVQHMQATHKRLQLRLRLACRRMSGLMGLMQPNTFIHEVCKGWHTGIECVCHIAHVCY